MSDPFIVTATISATKYVYVVNVKFWKKKKGREKINGFACSQSGKARRSISRTLSLSNDEIDSTLQSDLARSRERLENEYSTFLPPKTTSLNVKTIVLQVKQQTSFPL